MHIFSLTDFMQLLFSLSCALFQLLLFSPNELQTSGHLPLSTSMDYFLFFHSDTLASAKQGNTFKIAWSHT